MHAAALLMCAIVAGADVRESIATPQAMSDLLTRDAKQSSEVSWTFLKEGARMETTLHFAQDQKVTSHLRIVPCPEHPNLVLAGHVVPPTDDEVMRSYVGPTGFCALVDVDRNLVLSINGSRWTKFVPTNDVDDLTLALEKIGAQYCDLIAANPQKYEKSNMQADLMGTFINPPKITTECRLGNFNMNDATFYGQLRVTGGDRRLTQAVHFQLRDLLTSELAIPAADYFSAGPGAGVTKEKAQ